MADAWNCRCFGSCAMRWRRTGSSPASFPRSAWDRRFITAWARRCYDVRAWKFPRSGDIEDKAGFERYSQIVVVGYKHPQLLAEADEREVATMVQWRYTRDA